MKYSIRIFMLAFFVTTILYAQNKYNISGKVIDEIDSTPLIGVNIIIQELKLGTATDKKGEFNFTNIPSGKYSLKFSYIGHKTVFRMVVVPSENSNKLIVELREGSVDINEVVVTGNPLESDPKNISQSTLTISNLDLQIKRSSNIAQTLNFQPGISMRSNGTATARPVIRGFSSNRILILENGLRMGDLSNTSDDHGVSDDGSSPSRIEILRGPASLLYGSNAIGGVINVIDQSIPNSINNGINGEVNFEGSTASTQFAESADIEYGIGKTAFHTNLFNRKSKDYKSANGTTVKNSDHNSQGYQLGMAYTPDFGIVGVSYKNFKNKYGLPLNPNEADGEGPILIDMNKKEFRLLAESKKLNSFINSFSLKAGYQDYAHQELARKTNKIGTAFGLKTYSADLSFKHSSLFENNQGVIGLWGLIQNYTVTGEEAFTPDADYLSFAGYLFEQYKLNRFNFQFGVRFERNEIKIPNAIISEKLFPKDHKIFNSFSGSLGLVYSISDEVAIYSNIANAFRAPTIEELSSYAIHEATATFDIGDRNLSQENNIGIDVGLRLRKNYHWVELSGYYNNISNFIFRSPTNQYYSQIPDSTGKAVIGFNGIQGIPVYKYSQSDAKLYGLEAKALYEISRYWTTTVIFDYVRGKNKGEEQNLPQMPPFRFSLEQRYAADHFWAGIVLNFTAAQNNTAPNETPTKGYGLVKIYAGLKLQTGNFIHMIDIKIENLLDQPYKDHLSAIKQFANMPGRNIQLNYRFLF